MELSFPKTFFFEDIADVLFNVDISFANFEAPITESDFKGSVVPFRGIENCTILRSSVSQFTALAGYKGKYFSVLNFANNHAFDLGLEGLETTQRHFSQHGIMGIGTPRCSKDYGRPNIIANAGIKIGFISATFGLNNRHLPAGEGYRIHTAKLVSKYVQPDLQLLEKQIAHCKKEGCDFIVASLHWGYEFEFFPRRRQIETAHQLVERGVDLILGHHPHVVQPIEYYRTKRDPNRVAVIAYSLGGLGYGWGAAPHLTVGMTLKAKLSKGAKDGSSRTYIKSVEPVPVFSREISQGNRRLMRIEKLKGSVNQSNVHEAMRSSLGVNEQIKKYADLVLGNSPA